MDRSGLQDGDVVAIRADSEPPNGKIVIARLDNEATLKHYQRVDTRTIELHPESHNTAHQPRRIDLAEERNLSTTLRQRRLGFTEQAVAS